MENRTVGMTHVEALKKANNEAEYREWLRSIPGLHKTTGRNNNLVGIARAGIRTGRSDEQLMSDIIAAGGAPRLSDAEVRRAIAAAHRPLNGGGHAGCVALPSDGGRFLRQMIEVGKQMEADGCLPTVMPIGRKNPGQRYKEYLAHIWAIREACGDDGTGLWWTGKAQYDKRDRKSLHSHWSLIHARYRPFVIPNPMTGQPGLTGDGRESYACKATVKTAPLVICEFDSLSPDLQLLFWAGVLCEQTLDVRSIVWSGNRSFHVLVRVPDGRDRAEYVAYLRSIMPGIDPAPMHPAGLTRLAGGRHERSGNLARLVYCVN